MDSRIFISSLLDGNRDKGEERAEVAAVEAEDAEEEVLSGRHSSQQQQQQSMKAWPSERHRQSSSTGVAAQRANSRNCSSRAKAGRTRGGRAAIRGADMYVRVMLQMLWGRLHVTYRMLSAITVERSFCSLMCCFLLVVDDGKEEHLLLTFSQMGF